MKIRTSADVAALDQKVQHELGVDLGEYRNEEVVGQVSELIIFPVYVIQWVLRPVGLALLIFLISFFVLDLNSLDFVIYALLGSLLWLAGGLLSGILLLTNRFRRDLSSLLTYSTTILRKVVMDTDTLSTGTVNGNQLARLKLLYRGVLHIITIPVTSDIIGSKVPIMGGIVAAVVKWVLTVAANTFNSKKDEFTSSVNQGDDAGEGKILPIYVGVVSRFNAISQKALVIAIQFVQFPFKVGLGVFVALLILLIYLVN